MSARLHYLILCDGVTAVQGKKYYLGVFRTIFAADFPCAHGECALAAEISCDEGEHEVSVHIVDSSGEDVLPSTPPMKLKSGGPFSIIEPVFQLKNLPFKKPGMYQFQLEVDGEVIGVRDFMVEKMGSATNKNPK
ncbi:MAG: DUF6941 family protein [Planctomycetota bacterium]